MACEKEELCRCCGPRIDNKLECLETKVDHIHRMLHSICEHLKITGITLTHGDPVPNVSPMKPG